MLINTIDILRKYVDKMIITDFTCNKLISDDEYNKLMHLSYLGLIKLYLSIPDTCVYAQTTDKGLSFI